MTKFIEVVALYGLFCVAAHLCCISFLFLFPQLSHFLCPTELDDNDEDGEDDLEEVLAEFEVSR